MPEKRHQKFQVEKAEHAYEAEHFKGILSELLTSVLCVTLPERTLNMITFQWCEGLRTTHFS